MYNDIGGKIKTLARVIFVVTASVAVVMAIVLLSGELILLGLLTLILGPILAWASSFVLYGFGELIDKTCEIAKNTSLTLTPEQAKKKEQEMHKGNSQGY